MKTKTYFSETDDPVDIRYDNVFKAVFTKDTPASRGALSRLVSALIGRDVLVEAISANEPPVDSMGSRQMRFDINCSTKNGERINVEMGLNPDPFEPVRLEFHAGKLFTGQEISGSQKSYNDLKQAYQIAILAKRRFFADDKFLHTFGYYDDVNQVSLNGRTRIITLELAKVETFAQKSAGEMSMSESWAFFFQYLTDKRHRVKINEIAKREEGIAMASKVLSTISKSELEWFRNYSIEKAELDYQSMIVTAEREGLSQGRKEIARNALAKGLAPEFVQEITGLDLSEILRIKL